MQLVREILLVVVQSMGEGRKITWPFLKYQKEVLKCNAALHAFRRNPLEVFFSPAE